MFGKNKILKPTNSDGSVLQVKNIFFTFQGEGPYCGYPAIFIRLGGCNLACSFCDADFDNFDDLPLEEVLQKVKELSQINNKRKANLVVITGGEPMRQEIKKLCQELLDDNFLVQIETNGTIFRDLPKKVKIVCSPKNIDGKYYEIRRDLLPKITAFKFLISANNKNYQDIKEVGQLEYKTPLYLQPMDEYNDKKNRDNMNLTLQLAKKYGYRLSLQTHKVWQID